MSTLSPDGGNRTRQLARLGLLLALALALSLFESLLPPLPAPVPLRYGLANIAVMACLLLLGRRQAFGLAVLKSLFVFMTRGLLAGLVSLSGTLLSVLIMIALDWVSRGGVSIFVLSVLGALFHNAGQLLVLVFVIRYPLPLLLILPPLLIFGLLTGLLSAVLLYAMMRPLGLFFREKDEGGGERDEED